MVERHHAWGCSNLGQMYQKRTWRITMIQENG